jgi:heat shock protein HtpX
MTTPSITPAWQKIKGSQELGYMCLSTGLLDLFETEELEGVIAHELGHIRNRNVLVLILASLFSTAAGYLMQFSFYRGMVYGYYGGGGRARDDGAGMMAI